MLSLQSITLENLGSYKNQTHHFKNGGLKVIVGINKDTLPINYQGLSLQELLEDSDINLPSNGSGKSLISEGINLSLFGEVIRKDITPRDLIRKGEDFCKITLKCSNTQINLPEITIIRTIFSSKYKSSQVQVFEGEEEIKKSSVELLNKYILDRYIGISKENIINYFIIQNTRYKPFVSISDSKKKEMIAEFTGINTLGYVTEELQNKVNILNTSLKEQEDFILTYTGKKDSLQEILSSLISEEEFKKNHEQNNQKKLQQIELLKERLQDFPKQKEENLQRQDELKKYIQIWEERYKKIKQIWKDSQIYDQKVKENKENSKEIEEALNELDKYLLEANNKGGAITAKISKWKTLLKGVIECPNCKHKFNPADKKSKQELENELNQYQKEEKEIEISIQELKQDKRELSKLESENKKELNIIRSKVSQLDSILKICLSKKEVLQQLLKNTQSSLEVTKRNEELDKKEISRIQNEIEEGYDYSLIKKTRESTLQKIKNIEDSLKSKEENKIDLLNQIQICKDAQILFVNFKNYLFDKTVYNIQQICNYYLSQFCNLSVKLQNNKILADGKTSRDEITCLVEKDNTTNSFGILSNGEKMNINIAFILTFQHIINTNSGNGFNFLELDEVISALDSFNQNKMLQAINKLNKTIEIISHVKVIDNFDTTYIVKENNTSEIIDNFKN